MDSYNYENEEAEVMRDHRGGAGRMARPSRTVRRSYRAYRPGFNRFRTRGRSPYFRRPFGWRRWYWLNRLGQPGFDSGATDTGFNDTAPSQWVTWAQACLAQLVGSWVPQDGVMGAATQRAVQMFQMQQQLPPTGSLDQGTIEALRAACAGGEDQGAGS